MKRKNKENLEIQNFKLVDDNTPFAIKEAFNQLRTNILYTPNDMEGCPVYGITSAEMGVGKSTITANVALSFAQLGKKVLLVDADMRRPTQASIFGINKTQKGLSELLSGIAENDKDVVFKYSDDLSIITSGAIPPNPSALLLGKKIAELVKSWREKYDIVFIDLPPIGPVTDPLTISSDLNGYIFVATVNKSDSKHITDAIAKIEQVNSKVVGVVVNEVAIKAAGYSYNKHYYKNGNYAEYN